MTPLLPIIDPEPTSAYDISRFIEDPIEFVNEHFVDECSLSGIDALICDVSVEIRRQDSRLMDIIKEKAISGQLAHEKFEKLQCATNDLIAQMAKIQTPTIRGEQSLKILTADIRALNRAKINICNTIVNLKRLLMLSTMLESLGEKARNRKYNEAAGLAVAVRELCQLVAPLREAPPVVKLLSSCKTVIDDLKQQLTEDLEVMLALSTSQGDLEAPLELEDVCKCADAIDDGIRKHIASKYALYVEQTYESMFPAYFDLKSLENTNQRFAWLRRVINDFDEIYGSGVPQHWRVQAAGAWAFFDCCRSQIVSTLTSATEAFEPSVILTSLLRCKEFEQELDYRLLKYGDTPTPVERLTVEFPEVMPTPSNSPRTSMEPVKSLKGALSRCFENYLGPWVASEEAQLNALYAKIVSSSEDEVIMHVLRSAKELFTAISVRLKAVLAVSCEQTLFEMSMAFKRVVAKYHAHLHERLARLDRHATLTALAKQGGHVVATCDYCVEALEHLQDEIVEVIVPAYRDSVNFTAEREKINVTKSDAFKRFLDECCRFAAVSPNAVAPLRALEERVMEVVKLTIEHLPQCYLHYVTNKVTRAAMAHLKSAIFALDHVTEGYCQQLLLDSYNLQKMLVDSIRVFVDPLPLGYLDAVSSEMDKLQTLIKVLNSAERHIGAFEALLVENGGNCTREELDQILAIQCNT